MSGYSIKNYTDSGDYVTVNSVPGDDLSQPNYVSRFDTLHSSIARDRFRFKTDNSSKVSTTYTYITVPVG